MEFDNETLENDPRSSQKLDLDGLMEMDSVELSRVDVRGLFVCSFGERWSWLSLPLSFPLSETLLLVPSRR